MKVGKIFGLMLFLTITFIGPAFSGGNTETLCHGADGNPHTIVINENAVSAHLAHGDTIGPCGFEPPICGDGVTACGNACKDLSTDENNCGACGFVCPTGSQCVDGNCVVVCAPPQCPDADGDGFTDFACGGTDCNDQNASVFPYAPEVCDSLDNDCNGVIDDLDRDLDLHIDDACSGYSGTLPVDDCRDTNDTTYGGATELCGDGIDNNCDSFADEGC